MTLIHNQYGSIYKNMTHKIINQSNIKPELLAPAGSLDVCRAVIHAGADAVYLGGSRFSARAYAENFTSEELLEAIDYAHLHGRKIYLTINTLFKQPEIEILYDYLLPCYEQGLDAVIVQDFGVMQSVRTHFPDLPIHISTQMSVASAYGAAYLKSLGAVRIVPARELSLAEIVDIRRRVDIQIECFVHGALCYCYSGQCLLSSMLGGRSGNRGRCAQPCRLPYTVLDDQKRRLSGPECYPMSLKDLCTINEIPRLIEAGIDSFKIEGRMKSAEYAAGVTSIYRKYIDRYMSGGDARPSIQDYQRLLDTGNRSGFTSGYFMQRNGADMVTLEHPAHEKNIEAWVDAAIPKIPVRAEAFLKINEAAMLTVSFGSLSAAAEYGTVEAAKNQPISREMIETQLSKTGNTPFVMDSILIHMDDSVFLPKQTLNQLRRSALEKLAEQMLEKYRRKAQSKNFPEKDYVRKRVNCTNICFTAAIEEEPQLTEVLRYDFIKRIYLDSSMYTHRHFAAQLKEHVLLIKESGKQAYLILPAIFRRDTALFYKENFQKFAQMGLDGYLVKNQDELGFLEEMDADRDRCILDHSLYAYSNTAMSSYQTAGWKYDTIPLEMNKKELLSRENTASELVIYGRMPLMVSAQCVYHTMGQCKKTRSLCYLKDRYAKEFPVRTICSECCNILYNSQPLSLIQLSKELGRLMPAAYRLHFTFETKDEVSRVIHSCMQSFFEHQTPNMTKIIGDYTNGHYKRGVE